MGATSFSGPVSITATATLTGAGAVDPDVSKTYLVTTGADALTLADGSREGQQVRIAMRTDGGDGTLTPANLTGGSTITFNDVGDTVVLEWSITDGSWFITGGQGTTLA